MQPLPGARRTRRRCSGSCGPTARWRPMGWQHARPWHGRPPRVGRPARVRAPSGLVAARAAREAWGLTRRAAGVPFLAPTARARVKRLGVWRGGSAEEPSRDAHGERRRDTPAVATMIRAGVQQRSCFSARGGPPMDTRIVEMVAAARGHAPHSGCCPARVCRAAPAAATRIWPMRASSPAGLRGCPSWGRARVRRDVAAPRARSTPCGRMTP